MAGGGRSEGMDHLDSRYGEVRALGVLVVYLPVVRRMQAMEGREDVGCWLEDDGCWLEDKYLSRERKVSFLVSESTRVTTSRRQGNKPKSCWKIYLRVNKYMHCFFV